MGLRLLVAGRNAALRRAIKDALECFVKVSSVNLAATGRDCIALSERVAYDAILVDVDQVDMKCGTLLKKLMMARPGQRLIVTMDVSDTTIPAAEALARREHVSVVARPTPNSSVRFLEALREVLGRSSGRPMQSVAAIKAPVRPQVHAAKPAVGKPATASDFWITAIAVSTGGPSALNKMIPMLPGDYPHPVLIVQHMPPIFTSSLAKDLDAHSPLNVVEASEGDALKAGTVYIAPGGWHMEVQGGSVPKIHLTDAPPENSCRPSADVTYRSLMGLRPHMGVLAAVMTGMGVDGCQGIRLLKQRPCYCVAQSEDSCAVYGMPRAVIEAGLADETVDLMHLADRLYRLAKKPVALAV